MTIKFMQDINLLRDAVRTMPELYYVESELFDPPGQHPSYKNVRF
jgi:hypothetical protein